MQRLVEKEIFMLSIFKNPPPRLAVHGEYELCVVSIEWSDTLREITVDISKAVRENFRQLSHGMINITSQDIVYIPRRGFPGVLYDVKKLYATNEKDIKRILVIVHYGGNNYINKISNGVIYLQRPTVNSLLYFVGLYLGLPRADAMLKENGRQIIKQNADSLSFMNFYYTVNPKLLNAAQIYRMGWYAESQVAIYYLGAEETTYTLQLATNELVDGDVQQIFNAVMLYKYDESQSLFLALYPYSSNKSKSHAVPQAEQQAIEESGSNKKLITGKQVYCGDNILALHTIHKERSVRLCTFNDSAESNNFRVEVDHQDDGLATVRVSSRM